MVNNKRPVNLQLTTIRFPLPAIVSILHRASGVLVFLAIPLLLWVLRDSLQTRTGFYTVSQCLTQPFMKFVIWVVLSGLIYHLVAGIRHLFMDAGYCEELAAARRCSIWTLASSIILIILAGVWLW